MSKPSGLSLEKVKDWLRDNIIKAAWAFFIAAPSALLYWWIFGAPASGSTSSFFQNTVLLAFAATFAVIFLSMIMVWPYIIKHISTAAVSILVLGIKGWSERQIKKERLLERGDTVWDWLTDQMIVVRQSYAFSIGCLAYRKSPSGVQCLVLQRTISDFDDMIILWPGGRFRGAEKGSLAEAIKSKVVERTGCEVDLLIDPAENVNLKSSSRASQNITNQLFQPPAMLMIQNRVQSNGVLGHFDMLWIGTVTDDTGRLSDVLFLDVKDILTSNSYSETKLWPDTRECINRGSKIWEKHQSSRSDEERSIQ